MKKLMTVVVTVGIMLVGFSACEDKSEEVFETASVSIDSQKATQGQTTTENQSDGPD